MYKTIQTAGLSALAAIILLGLSGGSISASTGAEAPATGQASPPRAGLDTNTVPALLDPDADLRPQVGATNDSWYAVAHLSAGGHHYGSVIHYLQNKVAGLSISDVSLVDEATGWHTKSELTLAPGEGLSDSDGVSIHTDNITWTGNAASMALRAVVPEGTMHLTFLPTGPVLYNMGTGYFPLFDKDQYPQVEYAFPTMTTSGSLSLNGQTDEVTGQTWFDRQWGPQPAGLATGHASWTWMDLNLSNGDRLSLWDTIDITELAWATVLHPDGSQTIVEVTPVAEGASDVWTSPATGLHYPTHWTITIPSLDASLSVTTVTEEQEFLTPPRYEGSATVSGVYQGNEVTGYTYVELVF